MCIYSCIVQSYRIGGESHVIQPSCTIHYAFYIIILSCYGRCDGFEGEEDYSEHLCRGVLYSTAHMKRVYILVYRPVTSNRRRILRNRALMHYTLRFLYRCTELLWSLGWVGGRGVLLRTLVSRFVILYCSYEACVYSCIVQ